MKKYMFIYHAPLAEEMVPPSDDQVKAMMDAWFAWAEKVGDHLVDLGLPLANGKHVGSDGSVAESSKEVAGYSVLQGESMDEMLEFAKVHPHLNMPGGCTIEIHETQSLPGA